MWLAFDRARHKMYEAKLRDRIRLAVEGVAPSVLNMSKEFNPGPELHITGQWSVKVFRAALKSFETAEDLDKGACIGLDFSGYHLGDLQPRDFSNMFQIMKYWTGLFVCFGASFSFLNYNNAMSECDSNTCISRVSFEIGWMDEHHRLLQADLKRLTDQVARTSASVDNLSEHVKKTSLSVDKLGSSVTDNTTKVSNFGNWQNSLSKWTEATIATSACKSLDNAKVLCRRFDFQLASNVEQRPFKRHEWQIEKQHLLEKPDDFWGGDIDALFCVTPPNDDMFLVVVEIKQHLEVKSATLYWNQTERSKRFIKWALQCDPGTLNENQLECVTRLAQDVLDEPPRERRACVQAFQKEYGKCPVYTMIAGCKTSVDLAIMLTGDMTYVSWLTADGHNFASATAATIHNTLMEKHTAVEVYNPLYHEQIDL